MQVETCVREGERHKGRDEGLIRPCKWAEVTFMQVEGREGCLWLVQLVRGSSKLGRGYGIRNDELHGVNKG